MSASYGQALPANTDKHQLDWLLWLQGIRYILRVPHQCNKLGEIELELECFELVHEEVVVFLYSKGKNLLY